MADQVRHCAIEMPSGRALRWLWISLLWLVIAAAVGRGASSAMPAVAQVAGIELSARCVNPAPAVNEETTCSVTIRNLERADGIELLGATLSVTGAIGPLPRDLTYLSPIEQRALESYGDADLLTELAEVHGLADTLLELQPRVSSLEFSCVDGVATCGFLPGGATVTAEFDIRARTGGEVFVYLANLRPNAGSGRQVRRVRVGGSLVTVRPVMPFVRANCMSNENRGLDGMCTLLFEDIDRAPAWVASGRVRVALRGRLPTLIENDRAIETTCRSTDAVGPQSCQQVRFAYSVGASGLTGCNDLDVSFESDLPQVNPSRTLTIPGPCTHPGLQVGRFVEPTAFRVDCPGGYAGAARELAANSDRAAEVVAPTDVQAVLILGQGSTCTVSPVGGPIGRGAFIISSREVLSRREMGAWASEVAIPCGTDDQTDNAPACNGARFGVLGLAVGSGEITVQYEPASPVKNEGVVGKSVTFRLGIAIPSVPGTGLVNPNPSIVGGTVTLVMRPNQYPEWPCETLRHAFSTVECPESPYRFIHFTRGGTPYSGRTLVVLRGPVIVQPSSNPSVVIRDHVAMGRRQFEAEYACPLDQTLARPPNAYTAANAEVAARIDAMRQLLRGCVEKAMTITAQAAGPFTVTLRFEADALRVRHRETVSLLASDRPDDVLERYLNGIEEISRSSNYRTVEVVSPPSNVSVTLSRGCNVVSPTISEGIAQFVSRVTPAAALIGVWEYQPASGSFRGYSPESASPADLSAVARLRPLVICVKASATLEQPSP